MKPRRRSAWLLLPPALFLAAFYAYPLSATFAAGLGGDASWLASPYVLSRLRGAFLQALLSAALTLALALPLAWLHHRRAIPGSRWHLALHAAPFVMPVFVVVYGVQLVLGDAVLAIGPLGAVVIAHAYYNYGFAARLLALTLDRRPHRLEEAARTLGASPRGSFLRVSLPLLLPTMVSIVVLVFLFAFTSFGVVLLLGGGSVSTLDTMLYQQLSGAFPRRDRAALLGALQLALNLALLGAYALLHRRQAGLARDPARARLPARPWHVAAAWAALAAGLAPVVAVLAGGFRVRGDWSLEPWRALLDATHPAHPAGFDLLRALALSFQYALASAALAIALALLLAYGARRLVPGARALADALSALPLGTSSLLLGFGFLVAFGAGSAIDLRGARVAIVIVHALVAFPFVARILLPPLAMHEARLDEAAALLGASPRDIARRVHLPLLAGPLALAAGLAAAMSLGDFGASLLLMRPDTMGLSVWIARVDGPFDPMRRAQSIALAGLLLALVAGAYLVAERAAGREVARP